MGFNWVLKNVFLFSFIIILPAQSNSYEKMYRANWDYSKPDEWGNTYLTCNGERQSPVELNFEKSLPLKTPSLVFENYDITLNKPVVITNNGHTVELKIPLTKDGIRPTISGGPLSYHYEAMSLHFHWGSKLKKGSEHSIDYEQYDVEMHIVHKNELYESLEEAVQNEDGLVVLGVMIKKSWKNLNIALAALFYRLSEVIQYESEAIVHMSFKLDDLLEHVNIKKFYTYAGSLTTPPCSEAVTWIVFPEVTSVLPFLIDNFYNVKDSQGNKLTNNYRPIMDLNERDVYYCQTD